MFVVSLILDGVLKKNALIKDAGEAIETANKWYVEYQSTATPSSYISIHQSQPEQIETVPFAVLHFDEGDENVKVTLKNKNTKYSSTMSKNISIEKYLVPLVDLIVILTEQIRKRKGN